MGILLKNRNFNKNQKFRKISGGWGGYIYVENPLSPSTHWLRLTYMYLLDSGMSVLKNNKANK